MSAKIYVGGLNYAVTDDNLKQMFDEFGDVTSTTIIKDRETQRSRGFGFVEFANDDDAKVAIDAMSGKEVDGRKLTVNEARPREDRR